MPTQPKPIDIAELRARLQTQGGEAYWRSLEELAGRPEFREAVEREFPAMASVWGAGSSRREFLKVMGASLALVGLSGCFRAPPAAKIVPYVHTSQTSVTGRPMYFASAMPFDGYGLGVLAQSREGRPIKIEGNPDHPASLGATNVFMQASLLDLYDPDRSRSVRFAGQESRWGAFVEAVTQRLAATRGQGLRVLTGPMTSPTFAAQLHQLRQQYPAMRWHVHDPVHGDAASVLAEPVEVHYDLTHATAILSLDSDFLFREPGSLSYARQFIDGRRVRPAQGRLTMNRLYVAESGFSITGSMADHRVALAPEHIEAMAFAVAERLGVSTSAAPSLGDALNRWADAVAADLKSRASGTTLVLAGESQSPAVQALAHAMNRQLGNAGKAVIYTAPVRIGGGGSLASLVRDMQAGQVRTLVILGGNPAYTAPADVPFAEALREFSQARTGRELTHFTAHLSTHLDETSFLCQWHVNEAHWLESWGDVRAFDGTVSLVQPLIAPLYEGRTIWQVMDVLTGQTDRNALETIRDHWAAQKPDAHFEQWWLRTLQKGVVAGSALAPRGAPEIRADAMRPSPAPQRGITLVFEPDPTVWDGRFANNAWLQELPKPLTKLTWDNAIAINLRTAERLGTLRDGDVLRITLNGRSIEGPVMLLPGVADDVAVLTLGYGRRRGGHVLLQDRGPRGYDAYAIRSSQAQRHASGAQLAATGGFTLLAITRNHHAMDSHHDVPGVRPSLKPSVVATPAESEGSLALRNRLLVRSVTLPQLRDNHNAIRDLDPESKKPLLSLYPGWDYSKGHQWAMSIDTTACIGCNACVVACQAENNIPVVGKSQVLKQREMHWIRIDDYFTGPLDSPQIVHQPVPCMHCENAPCEYVCPTGATTHSAEGINEMTYNRCIGTRYCSNNCPYKVRRFNFLLYNNYSSESMKLARNPEVTVRSRGVMEKCTYCIQRIDNTRIELEREELESAGAPADERSRLRQRILGTLQTACQQACPTNAIVFGDLHNPSADVVQLKREPTDYVLLRELTTKPRTSYLGHITNPNPALVEGGRT